jgi:hypothetical protein
VLKQKIISEKWEVVMATLPRHPRSGNTANQARSVTTSGQYWVQLTNASGTWTNAIRVTDSTRASTIATRLNDIFAISNADLDFISPSYDPDTSTYTVVWSGVKWDSSFTTTTTNMGSTSEYLYTGCHFGTQSFRSKTNVKLIASVTSADMTLLGLTAWQIAFNWANGIRGIVNGWNCSKDSTGGYLISNGYIPNLISVGGNWSGTSTTIAGSYYGLGETQPNFTIANTEIFHTCDLIVARPNTTNNTSWPLNRWIKVTYNNKSVVARIADVCGTAKVDLSAGGVAYSLGFPGSGNVTVSTP